jgi:hypothetical protein
MSKVLLVIVQSKNVDTYVNVLVHCFNHENIKKVFFLGEEVLTGQGTELEDTIHDIYRRLRGLSESVPSTREYLDAFQGLPPEKDLKEHIIRMSFVRPHLSVATIKKRFSDTSRLVIDITGTSKQLAGDIIVSFLSNGLQNVSHFVLEDKVYSDEWKQIKKTRMYHDIVDDNGIRRYEYVNFAESYSTISSIRKLRSQGRWVRLLLATSMVLLIFVVGSLYFQEITITWVAAVTSLFVGVGALLQSMMNIFKYVDDEKLASQQ